MDFKEYTVKIYADGSKEWLINGKRHREDGPAVEFVNGTKEWWIDSVKQPEPKSTCSGKMVEIDGVKYKLVAM